MTGLRKVYGGTPRGEFLCRTCKWGHKTKGEGQIEDEIYCFQKSKEVKFKVIECSEYKNTESASLREMEDMAWILCTKGGAGRTVGFMPNKEFRKQNRDEEILPDY